MSKGIIFLIAGLIGIVFVRTFMLNPIEEIAWGLFWATVGNGDLSFNVDTVLHSTTFLKTFAGFGLAGTAGVMWFEHEQKRKNA